jgi:hypothetical protein
MSAKFTLEGSASGAVKAIDQATAALDKTGKAAEGAVKSTRQLNAEAQRIKESIDPQEKFNRKLVDLKRHLDAGRLSIDQVERATAKYRGELDAAGRSTDGAFGSKALAGVASMATQYLSVAAAVGTIVAGLREKAAEEERAAQRAQQSRAGLGVLSQLASSEKDPKQAFKDLVAEARGFVAGGVVQDEGAAGELLFQLAGAGLNRRDRSFAAQVKAAGTLQNVGGAAEAYSALKTALGEGEVGTFQQFMSKSLKAAGPAPGSFEQLPIAAAQSGGSAKALGISDEFLLAATTMLGKQSGSISEGGTLLAALLRGVEKSGLNLQGVGGLGVIDALSALPAKQQGLGGVLGDRAEAVSAFRTLRDNRGDLAALMSGVSSAQEQNLAGAAAALPNTDDQLFAARTAFTARMQAEQASNEASSTSRNLLNTMRSNRQTSLFEQGRTFDAAMERGVAWAGDWIPGFGWAQQQGLIAGAQAGGDDSRELMRRQTEAMERLDRRTGSKVTTRQE